jgi:hypothetical protein
MSRRLRLGLALLVAVVGLAVPETPVVRAAPTRVPSVAPMVRSSVVPATPVYPAAVDMTVDYAAKTITVTARIDFYQSGGTRVSQSTIDAIVAAIEAAWNGHKFKCFNVIVHVNATAIQVRSGARPDAVDIRLDSSRLRALSRVVGTGTGNFLSDDPADRVQPGRDLSDPNGTTWGRYTDPAVWPHEFGHVLGLDDNYDQADNSQVLPGARRDMMFSQGLEVSAEMITRVVRRNNHGQLDESRIKCPLSMDAGPASLNLVLVEIKDLTIHAYTCDYDPPSGDQNHVPRPISWKGTGSLSGSYNIPVLGGSGSFSGPITFTSEAEKPYSFTLTSSSGSATFGGTYRWTTMGVPVNIGPMTLGGVSSAMVGLGLYPVFSEGASECP